MQDFEKLGWFYLGRTVDPATGTTSAAPLLYDSRDLVTHALIVGMTGSGKTGLGVCLLEEAAIDGVPALVIDPKGDLANLFLTFPELRAEDFLPWVRAEDAERRAISREQLAEATATRWRDGLSAWGEDGERIRKLRAAADVVLYTPGSDLARPISILASFAAPPATLVADTDLFRDRVETAATSLLTLAGVDADPLRSREHILVSSLLSEAWRAGRGYDLASLIADVQKPPLTKVGVMDLETFYPAADRFALAMRINSLLAAPGFDVWTRGEPLALDRLLYGEGGKPRLAVISIAHLSDAERMFFVSLLLGEAVGWVRSKSGTSSLRALLYMDEVTGYLPPVAEPPSKKPMLVLLKQARAFGLGVVLATQNPVDLDYKALSNVGSWFLGRLQTERDKARVLDGLEGAAAAGTGGMDRAALDRTLSGVREREFLLHDVHETAPVLFETRWAMSYLAGPLDREQLRRLAAGAAGVSADAVPATRPEPPAAITASPVAVAAVQAPLLPPSIPQVFLAPSVGTAAASYRPALLGEGRAYVEDAKRGVSERVEVTLVASMDADGSVDWSAAERLDTATVTTADRPSPGTSYAPLPARAARPESYGSWQRSFAAALSRIAAVSLFRSVALAELSRAGESERDFRIRLADIARTRRDKEIEQVRAKYSARTATLDDRLRRAEAKVGSERQQASAQRVSTIVAGAATVAGLLFGRRRLSATNVSRLGTAVRSFGREQEQTGDVAHAQENVETLRARKEELEQALAADLAAIAPRLDAANELLETVEVRARKGDVEVRRVALAWDARARSAG